MFDLKKFRDALKGEKQLKLKSWSWDRSVEARLIAVLKRNDLPYPEDGEDLRSALFKICCGLEKLDEQLRLKK